MLGAGEPHDDADKADEPHDDADKGHHHDDHDDTHAEADHEDTHAEAEETEIIDLSSKESISEGAFLYSLFIVSALMLGHLVHRAHITWLPESIVLIGVGAILGIVLRWRVGSETIDEYFGEVNVVVVNVLLLPPIILESGWTLRRKDFFSQIEYILVFAVIGTLISTAIVCFCLVKTGAVKDLNVAFTFASLISATDPVATLATYSKLQVEPLLNIMVFGESIINDAVAIALFKSGNDLKEGEKFPVGHILGDMCHILIGSPLVGLVVGCAMLLLMWQLGVIHNDGAITPIITMSSWLCFGLADMLGVSGIIATLFYGILLASFLKERLGAATQELIGFQMTQQAALADMTIFIFVGVFTILLLDGHNFGLTAVAVIACILARTLSVFPLGILVNTVKRFRARRNGQDDAHAQQLSNKHMLMMWHAGLRGGISMSLCLELRQSMTSKDVRDSLQAATFSIICLFLMGFGGTTQLMLEYLGIPMGSDCPEDALVKGTPKGMSMYYSAAARLGGALESTAKTLSSFGGGATPTVEMQAIEEDSGPRASTAAAETSDVPAA